MNNKTHSFDGFNIEFYRFFWNAIGPIMVDSFNYICFWKWWNVNLTKTRYYIAYRDFKIWYCEAVVRRQIVKITFGDVTMRVPLRLSCRSLAFYYEEVPGFKYSSLREYKPAV